MTIELIWGSTYKEEITQVCCHSVRTEVSGSPDRNFSVLAQTLRQWPVETQLETDNETGGVVLSGADCSVWPLSCQCPQRELCRPRWSGEDVQRDQLRHQALPLVGLGPPTRYTDPGASSGTTPGWWRLRGNVSVDEIYIIFRVTINIYM